MSAEQPGGAHGSGAVSDRMRALLSRAAEEQLHEQRQVSTVLGELRSLVEDVDERLATGEQVERVADEVRALSTRVEARLDAAEARSAELAERIADATAMVGRAAQELVETVAERVEAHLREVTAGLAASVGDHVAGSERRLAVHVDDAVLALAEVVLRRGRPPAPASSGAASGAPVQQPPVEPAAEAAAPSPGADAAEEPPADDPPTPSSGGAGTPPDVPGGEPLTDDRPAQAVGHSPPLEAAPQDPVLDVPGPSDPEAEPTAAVPSAEDDAPAVPDGYVLVPADVPDTDAAPAPPVPEERRTAERRTAERSDGSGRRRRPWWRPA